MWCCHYAASWRRRQASTLCRWIAPPHQQLRTSRAGSRLHGSMQHLSMPASQHGGDSFPVRACFAGVSYEQVFDVCSSSFLRQSFDDRCLFAWVLLRNVPCELFVSRCAAGSSHNAYKLTSPPLPDRHGGCRPARSRGGARRAGCACRQEAPAARVCIFSKQRRNRRCEMCVRRHYLFQAKARLTPAAQHRRTFILSRALAVGEGVSRCSYWEHDVRCYRKLATNCDTQQSDENIKCKAAGQSSGIGTIGRLASRRWLYRQRAAALSTFSSLRALSGCLVRPRGSALHAVGTRWRCVSCIAPECTAVSCR